MDTNAMVKKQSKNPRFLLFSENYLLAKDRHIRRSEGHVYIDKFTVKINSHT